jgi:uncharacterized repeat protein (TIGR02543 family)
MTFTYRPEYYLRVDRGRADFPSVEGWYDESTLVKVPSAPEYANATAAVRCIFDYWMVDGGKVPGNPISVVMDKPHNISTRYRTQYYVDVMSEFDNPTGSGWYDTNSTANISVTTPQGFGVQKVFDGWEGDGVSKSPTISILVDSPKTLTAVWHDDYTQAYTGIVMIVAAVSVLLTVLVRPRKKAESKTEPKT